MQRCECLLSSPTRPYGSWQSAVRSWHVAGGKGYWCVPHLDQGADKELAVLHLVIHHEAARTRATHGEARALGSAGAIGIHVAQGKSAQGAAATSSVLRAGCVRFRAWRMAAARRLGVQAAGWLVGHTLVQEGVLPRVHLQELAEHRVHSFESEVVEQLLQAEATAGGRQTERHSLLQPGCVLRGPGLPVGEGGRGGTVVVGTLWGFRSRAPWAIRAAATTVAPCRGPRGIGPSFRLCGCCPCACCRPQAFPGSCPCARSQGGRGWRSGRGGRARLPVLLSPQLRPLLQWGLRPMLLLVLHGLSVLLQNDPHSLECEEVHEALQGHQGVPAAQAAAPARGR